MKAVRALLLVLLLLLPGLGWLLGTTSGLRSLWTLLQPALGATVQIDGLDGRLLGPVSVARLRLVWDGGELQLERLRVDYGPASLLLPGPLWLDASAESLHIATHSGVEPAAGTGPPEPRALARALPPLAVSLRSLRVGRLQLDRDLRPQLRAQDIELSAHGDPGQLRIDALQAQVRDYGRLMLQAELLGDDAGLHLSRVALRGALNIDGHAALRYGDGALDGELRWTALRWPLHGQALADSPQGTLRLGGHWSAPAAELSARLGEATELRAEARWASGELMLDARWKALRWPLRGEPMVRSRAGELQLSGAPDELQLTLDGELDPAGRLQAHGALRAEGPELSLAWQRLSWPQTGEAQLQATAGQARVHGAWSAPRFELDTALGPGGRLQGDGELSDRRLALNLSGRALQWPLVEAPAVLTVPTLQLELQGVPDDWQASLRAEALAANSPLRLSARARGDMRHAELDQVRIQALDGKASGRAELHWAQALHGSAELTLAGLNPGRQWPAWSGSLNGQARAELQLAATPVWSLSWALQDSRLRGREIRSSGRLLAEGEDLRAEAVALDSGASRLRLDGQLLPAAALNASLDSDDLADWLPGLAGSANVTLRVDGDWSLPALRSQGRVEAAGWGPYRIAMARWSAELDAAGAVQLSADAEGLDLGYRFERAAVHASGPIDAHRIEVEAVGEDAQGRMTVRGAYDAAARQWRGELVGARLDPARFAAWVQEAPTGLLVSLQRIEMEPVCASGDDGRLCAQWQWTPEQLHLATRLDALELAALQPLLPPDWRGRGRISGRASLRYAEGRVQQAQAELQAAAGELRAGASARLVFEQATLRLREAERRADLELRLQLPSGELYTQAYAAGDGPFGDRQLRGQLRIDWPDIAALSLISPEIAEASGQLSGAFELGGTVSTPNLDGDLAIRDGELLLRSVNARIEDLQAHLNATPTQGLRLQAGGRLGEGEFRLDGEVAADGTRAELRLSGSSLLAVNTAEARITLEPDLRIRIGDGAVYTEGRIVVPKAEITPSRFDAGGIQPSADQVLVSENEELAPRGGLELRSRIELVLGDAVHFEGFGLDTRLTGTLRTRDEPGELTTAIGELRLLDGQYTAYGQDLSIETGRLIYAGGAISNPAVELSAVRRPRKDIVVGVQVRGPLQQPSLSLFSTPPMSDENRLSWLVLGRGTEAGASRAEQAVLGDAALALGLKGTALLTERIGEKLGLDEFSVGSAPGEPANQAQLTIGKYLNPRLFVSYGVGLFQPGYSLKLNYDIGRGFELQTETGTQSGADLIYTIERGGPGAPVPPADESEHPPRGG